MQISSLIDIVDGKLLNSPSISFIYSFKTNPFKIKEGDLFIAKKNKDIALAVQNGAFAIITENLHPILDNEIAWIKVNDVNLCLIKLLRFKLANINLKALYCDNITYELLNIYSNSLSNIKLCSDDIESLVKKVDYIEDEDFLICNNKDLLNQIYPNNDNFNKEVFEITNLTEHSLFEVSFSYEDYYFNRLKLASLYIPQFISVYNFLNKSIDLSKTKNFPYFKPIFLDKNLEIVEFGRSEKFIVVQNNKNLISDEIKYITNKFKYAKLLFISNKFQTQLDNENLIIIENIDKLKHTLKENSFNAVYIYGYSFDEVHETLNRTEKQKALF